MANLVANVQWHADLEWWTESGGSRGRPLGAELCGGPSGGAKTCVCILFESQEVCL